jgi:amino acid transporter
MTRMQQTRSLQEEKVLSEIYVPQTMPRSLGLFDMIALSTLAIFWVSNVTGVAIGGAASFTYWMIGIVCFFLPCTLVCAQLGILYPHEGSIYNWTLKALGPFWAFFVSLCTWLPGIVSVVSAADVIISGIQTRHPTWLVQPWQQGMVMIGIILVVGVLSCQRVRTVQYLINAVFATTILLVVLIACAMVAWLLQGHPMTTDFRTLAEWLPQGGGPQTNNFALLGTVTLALLGTTGPLTMAGEVKSHIPVTRYLLWGATLVMMAYLVCNAALLVVQGPTAALNAPNSVVLVLNTVTIGLGPVGGDIAYICLMLFFVMVAVIYNCTYARLVMVVSIDGQLPVRFARLNRSRVPVTAIWTGTLFAILLVVIIFFVVPLFTIFGNPQLLNSDAYLITAAGLLLVWAFSFLFPFIDFCVLYSRSSAMFKEKRLMPAPILLACCIVGPLICILTIIDTVANSFAPTLIDNGHWTLFVVTFMVVSLAICGIGSMFVNAQASFENFDG